LSRFRGTFHSFDPVGFAIFSAAGISAKAFWRELYQLQGEGQALDITAVLQTCEAQ
jgi:hypothetical protein